MTQLWIALHLAWAELRYDWRMTMCVLAAIVGILVPLSIIFALKVGVIDRTVSDLIEDPRNREIITIGSGVFPISFFEQMRRRDDVAFIIPNTRSLSAQADRVRIQDTKKRRTAVDLIPTGPGDPLLDGHILSAGEVALSASLARSLGVSTQDLTSPTDVQILITRKIDGEIQSSTIVLKLGWIARPELMGHDAVFVAPSVLYGIERFRDNPEVTDIASVEASKSPASFVSFRLYASSIFDVDDIVEALRVDKRSVRALNDKTDLLISFQRNATIVFLFISLLALTGLFLALASNIRGLVEQQRTQISVLSLLGMTPHARSIIPHAQSLILISSSIVLTLIILIPSLWGINTVLGGGSRPIVADLSLNHVLQSAIVLILMSICAAHWAARAAKSVMPKECMYND